jgi:methionyl-tRNA formyltransferase
MNIVFFGTDGFAREILKYLIEENLNIVAVVTQQDKPKGRSLKMEPPPVKDLLTEINYSGKIFQPAKASDQNFLDDLKELNADLFVVVSYGQLLKQVLLDIPKYGTINVHPSLLPKYRGASPIQSVVLAGEKKTGVTIMEMVLAMDAGGIIKVHEINLPEDMTYGELENKLIEVSKPLLKEVIFDVDKHKKLISTPQDETQATFTKKIFAESSFIDWNQGVKKIIDFVRGMNPKPGARVFAQYLGNKVILKIFKVASFNHEPKNAGEIIHFDEKNGLVISAKDGCVSILEVQLEGKKKMSIKDFINGFLGKIQFFSENLEV